LVHGEAVTDETSPQSPEAALPDHRAWSRRTFLTYGLGGAAVVLVAGVTGVELVSHGVLPGKQSLDQLDGACSVTTSLEFSEPGPSRSGTFYSTARKRPVGYTIAYPPGHGPGSVLPLVVMLHGFGANHTNALSGMTPAQAVALKADGISLAAMAMVTVDGGGGYWNPHHDDDPVAMVIEELIPMCQALGLGRAPQTIGMMGISMGGYGALLLAEKHPHLITAVAAISPAIWTSYPEAHGANAGAFSSAASFSANNVIDHAGALVDMPTRVASGDDDPFHPGVEAFARAAPPRVLVEFSRGCHTDPFFRSQEPPSMSFLADHLTA
jgi:pimeloyl-ACP methyl ester carboxylesterase